MAAATPRRRFRSVRPIKEQAVSAKDVAIDVGFDVVKLTVVTVSYDGEVDTTFQVGEAGGQIVITRDGKIEQGVIVDVLNPQEAQALAHAILAALPADD
jgi:hypothetical protein